MEVTVKEKFNRTAPRKLRLVANLIRGWDAQKALNQLKFIPKAAAQDLTKTLQSALGAAKESNMNLETVYIKSLMINEGPSLKRRVYMSRGRASMVKKHMSHIIMTVAEKDENTVMPKIKGSKKVTKDENLTTKSERIEEASSKSEAPHLEEGDGGKEK